MKVTDLLFVASIIIGAATFVGGKNAKLFIHVTVVIYFYFEIVIRHQSAHDNDRM